MTTPQPSPLYGPGRRTMRATPIYHTYEDTSLPSTSVSSRLGFSPITQSSGDTSDRLTGPMASRNRRASTTTTLTTVSRASQTSRLSESAPRYRNLPDPLPCPKCIDKSYSGLDRKTNLERHDREVHQQIRIPCPTCPRTFSRTSNLRRHQEICGRKGER